MDKFYQVKSILNFRGKGKSKEKIQGQGQDQKSI
jgi:hypothetical protein